MRASLVAVCVLAVSASVALGQTLREVRGAIQDTTGGVIVGATVQVVDPSGAAFDAQTDGSGRYRIVGLAPGVSIVTIRSPGFADVVSKVDLTRRSTGTLDMTLQIAMKEQVEVTAGDALAGAEVAGGFTVSGRDVDALPNDPVALLRRLQEMLGNTGDGDTAQVRVDGFGLGRQIPAKAAIQMIRFTTNAFAAEFAEPGRGIIDIVTKPGVAKLVGEMNASFNDTVLNARNAFAPRRSPVQTRTLSGYASGPLIPSRWGVQLHGGHWMQDVEDLVNATVLSAGTLVAQPFVTTVGSATRTRYAGLGSDIMLGKHRLALGVDYSDEWGQNQGLGDGLDLPERAYSRTAITPSARVALDSAGRGGATNELRMEWSRPRLENRAISTAAAVLVLDTFNGGGNQRLLFRNDVSPVVRVGDRVTFAPGRHRVKFGFDFETIGTQQIDQAEFAGTFVFGSDFERDAAGDVVRGPTGEAIGVTPLEGYRRTLLGLPGYGPSQLTIERGDPTIDLNRWWLAEFLQVDWRRSPRFTLSYGVRHTLQQDVRSTAEVAPRLAMAWAADAKSRSRVRFGAGLFHQRIPTTLAFNALRYDGRRQRFVVARPAFSSGALQSLSADQQILSTYVISDSLQAPRIVASALSYERTLQHTTTVSIAYNGQIGDRQLRMRNINAPLPGAATPPRRDRGPVLQYESTGRSTRHELPVNIRASLAKWITLRGSYTVGFRYSDTEGFSSAPADPYALSNEFGPSDSDRRHRVYAQLGVTVPGGVDLNTSVSFWSGRPFNITTGRDNNGDSLFLDRPSIATAGAPHAVTTAYGVFNPNPLPGERIVGRNAGREPNQTTVDLYVAKAFRPAGDGARAFSISMHASNVFNLVNLAGMTGVITSPRFGTPRRARDPRRVDLGAKWTF